jgi:hypothetical protein
MKVAKYYTDSQGKRFEVLAVWSPNEESDTWVRYVNTRTGNDYTCRLEAFLSRFSALPD